MSTKSKPTVEELFGASAAEAHAIFNGPMTGIPPEYIGEYRDKMLWLANGDIAVLRELQAAANSDWRDIEGEYQSETNLERFRNPPRRNWSIE